MIRKANCKINLGLDILRRRPDGYHDLETVMIPVRGLCDTLSFTPLSTPEPCFSSSGLVVDCPAEENLCIKSWQLMHKRYGIGGLEIHLDKQIPFGAGLGGGSADAARVITAINEAWELNLPTEELEALAAELGSDTPFFIRNTPQLCRGRGEVMSPITLPIGGLWLLLVKPNEGISTREAYAGVTPCVPDTPLCERLQAPVHTWQECVVNDFERSIFPRHPRLAHIKESLLRAGALYAAMSGSGSTLFGLFDQKPAYTPPYPDLFLHCEQL